MVARLADPRLREEVMRAAERVPALSLQEADSAERAVELIGQGGPDAALVEIVDRAADLRALSELGVGAGTHPVPLLLTGKADSALVGALRRAGLFARTVPEGRDADAICLALLEMSPER